jgi:hypothetical protein
MGTAKDIREAVEAELESDPLDADIHVVNINGTWLSTAPYHRLTRSSRTRGGMTAHQSVGIPPGAQADRAPPHRGRRRPAVRWIVPGVLFVAPVVGLFVLATLGAQVRFRRQKEGQR